MADAKAQTLRPLSPHLQIYRWTWTMAMSIFHRATGVALYAGTVLVAVWLLAMASGPAAYGYVGWLLGSPIGLLVLFGYTWALMHHMLGGVRHLTWDTGYGFEPGMRIRMARLTAILSPILTVAIWIVAYLLR